MLATPRRTPTAALPVVPRVRTPPPLPISRKRWKWRPRTGPTARPSKAGSRLRGMSRAPDGPGLFQARSACISQNSSRNPTWREEFWLRRHFLRRRLRAREADDHRAPRHRLDREHQLEGEAAARTLAFLLTRLRVELELVAARAGDRSHAVPGPQGLRPDAIGGHMEGPSTLLGASALRFRRLSRGPFLHRCGLNGHEDRGSRPGRRVPPGHGGIGCAAPGTSVDGVDGRKIDGDLRPAGALRVLRAGERHGHPGSAARCLALGGGLDGLRDGRQRLRRNDNPDPTLARTWLGRHHPFQALMADDADLDAVGPGAVDDDRRAAGARERAGRGPEALLVLHAFIIHFKASKMQVEIRPDAAP